MRLDGTLKSWNDERGFGFIEPTQGGQEIFVHISAFPGGSGRPRIGQAITFAVALGPNGKKRAHSVGYAVRARVSRQKRTDSPAEWTWLRALAIPAFIGLYIYASQTWGVKPVVLVGYGAASIVTFFAYAFDKAAAVRRSWRTSEQTLHVLSIAGGWPGALVAQQLLRHKSSKPSFVVVFWATVALNVGAFVAWHAGLMPSIAIS